MTGNTMYESQAPAKRIHIQKGMNTVAGRRRGDPIDLEIDFSVFEFGGPRSGVRSCARAGTEGIPP